jgi:drug/metabolite transporter (DMT)-like permease
MNWKQIAICTFIFYSIASLVLRYYEKQNNDITPFQIFVGLTIIQMVLLLIIYIFSNKYRSEVNTIILNKQFILWIGLYALLLLIGDLLYFYSHINTPHIALLLAVIMGGIMIEVVGSYYLFGEKLKKNSILGISLIVIGLLLLENSNKGLKEEMPKKL